MTEAFKKATKTEEEAGVEETMTATEDRTATALGHGEEAAEIEGVKTIDDSLRDGREILLVGYFCFYQTFCSLYF